MVPLHLLDPHIGLIYGDSITPERQIAILQGLKEKGFASFNVVLGIGSYTYQYLTRDTFGCAMKATYGEVADQGRNIFKDPKTDDGTKKSARGLLKVTRGEYGFKLEDEVNWTEERKGALEVVFRDGELLREEHFERIRERMTGAMISTNYISLRPGRLRCPRP